MTLKTKKKFEYTEKSVKNPKNLKNTKTLKTHLGKTLILYFLNKYDHNNKQVNTILHGGHAVAHLLLLGLLPHKLRHLAVRLGDSCRHVTCSRTADSLNTF